MKKVLYISPYAPYDGIDHAGGKIHNYNVKSMSIKDDIELFLISAVNAKNLSKMDLDKYGISNELIIWDKTPADKILRKLTNDFSLYNPFDKYGNMLGPYYRYKYKSAIKRYINNEGKPDIIITQWIQVSLLIPWIKKFCPGSTIVAIEEDVAFQGFERWIPQNGIIKKWIAKWRFNNIKKIELNLLNLADKIVTNCEKDTLLLINEGISKEKIFTTVPYYDDYSYIKNNSSAKNIIFFGNMARKENHQAVEWFVENVFNKISNPEVKFIIIGSKPVQRILDLQNERIIVTGFVENPDLYFENCMCFVAPLLNGAGIKIKVLEALSAGLTVLTNDIGIEGIPVEDRVHYYHCEDAGDYISTITDIICKGADLDMKTAAKEFINKQFNYKVKFADLLNQLL